MVPLKEITSQRTMRNLDIPKPGLFLPSILKADVFMEVIEEIDEVSQVKEET